MQQKLIKLIVWVVIQHDVDPMQRKPTKLKSCVNLRQRVRLTAVQPHRAPTKFDPQPISGKIIHRVQGLRTQLLRPGRVVPKNQHSVNDSARLASDISARWFVLRTHREVTKTSAWQCLLGSEILFATGRQARNTCSLNSRFFAGNVNHAVKNGKKY